MIDGNNCPECDGDLGESRQFNLMFKTFMGPLENDSAVVYLRPETAQAMFVNFDNVHTTSRKKYLLESLKQVRASVMKSRHEISLSDRVNSNKWKSSSSVIPINLSSGTNTGVTDACSGTRTWD